VLLLHEYSLALPVVGANRKEIPRQNILCDLGFSLYIRASPHQARDSVLRDWAGFFVARNPRFLAALCLEKNAHD